MMWNAELFGQLASEQFRSRPGHRSIEQAWNKMLSFDLVRKQRRTAALCSNGMKSCYDRLVHSVASIVMQQQNVLDTACICMFTTLQNLEHTVRTIYGDSDDGYGGTVVHCGRYPHTVWDKETERDQQSGRYLACHS
jgi:hypothetical protein